MNRYIWLTKAAFGKKNLRASKFRESEGVSGSFRIFLKVISSTTKNLPQLLKKRKKILNSRNVTNNEIRSWFKRFGTEAKYLYIPKE